MAGPLTGIKVVEFTEYIAGPYAGMLLADMGADVVKVERPEGDEWRHTAPVAHMEGRGHLSVNRGKRGVSLDLEREDGREIARRLCETADIVLVGYRPGVAERFGLDYGAVAAIKPDVIYCENSAFGREGPYAGRPGFDILSQAATGMITYENKIERGLPTFIYTLAVADISTGMFLAYSAVCAILHRNLTGRGQRIETSLFASGLAAQTRPLLSVEDVDAPVREGFLAELRAARERGDVSFDEASKLRADYIPRRGRNNYYRVYETRDSLIAIACLNNRQRRAFRDLLGVADPTVEGKTYDWFSEEIRVAHKETTEPYESAIKSHTNAELIDKLDAAKVPCAPVHFPEEVIDHPHVAANNLIWDLDHPTLGTLRMPGSPVRMSETMPEPGLPPPPLGAHNREVLRELGYIDAEIDRLSESGVLAGG